MTEAELTAIVESKLEARLAARMQAERARVREEVIRDLRREVEREHHAKINAKHPIEDRYGGLGPEGHAARLREMDARARRCAREMDEINARPVEGSVMSRRRADAAGGTSGFKIKG
jgi:hypothetical protein